MGDTITTAGGQEIPITDDVDEVDVYAVAVTVSGSKTVNLGNYENREPYASVKSEIRPALRVDDNLDAIRDLADRLRIVVDHHLRKTVEEEL